MASTGLIVFKSLELAVGSGLFLYSTEIISPDKINLNFTNPLLEIGGTCKKYMDKYIEKYTESHKTLFATELFSQILKKEKKSTPYNLAL